jgi:CDP-paratose 2-epimerase
MKIVITGGAGFLGCNVAEFYAKKRNDVIIADNLSRKGSQNNLDYVTKKYPHQIKFLKGDIRDKNYTSNELSKEMEDSGLVLHLAAQVAVTTSITNPREDFEINALGTFNILESLRKVKDKTGKAPPLIYSSTNKVYGRMDDVKVIDKGEEYGFKNLPNGVDEERLLDFHSPYGCSKGGGDQYVRDYARIYDLDTIVMRQSCIYGRRQFGMEDQGWLAWFTLSNIFDNPITIFGDGKQVRDVLFVDDLINAYELARQNIKKTTGQVYNIGGGPKNTLSLSQAISLLESFSGKKMSISYSDWRKGDQKVCIMDISKAKNDFKWKPKINAEKGMKKLYSWAKKNTNELRQFL